MNLLRTIKKLTVSSTVKTFFAKWKVDGQDHNAEVDVFFPIGCVGISKNGKSWINKFQADNNALLVSDASSLIQQFSLKENDYFYGDSTNYLLLQDGNLTIKTKSLIFDCQDINITTTGNITINGIVMSFADNKVSINDKEIAVVGGEISTATNNITTSGQ